MIRRTILVALLITASGFAFYRLCYIPYRCDTLEWRLRETTRRLYQLPSSPTVAAIARRNLQTSRNLATHCAGELAVALNMIAAANARILGQPDVASGFYRAALELDRRPELYYNLGEMELATGNTEEAIRTLARAVTFDPKLESDIPPQIAAEVKRAMPGDHTPPTVRIDPLPLWTNHAIAAVTGTARDDPGGVGVRMNVAGIRENPEAGCQPPARDWNGTGWVSPCTTMAGTAQGRETWVFDRMPPASALTSGHRYTVFINSVDYAGNEDWSQSRTFLYDSTPPEVSIDPRSDRLSGTATDAGGSRIAAVRVSIVCNGGSFATGTCVGTGMLNAWNGTRWVREQADMLADCKSCPADAVTWAVSLPKVESFIPGKLYTIRARALDRAGNTKEIAISRILRP